MDIRFSKARKQYNPSKENLGAIAHSAKPTKSNNIKRRNSNWFLPFEEEDGLQISTTFSFEQVHCRSDLDQRLCKPHYWLKWQYLSCYPLQKNIHISQIWFRAFLKGGVYNGVESPWHSRKKLWSWDQSWSNRNSHQKLQQIQKKCFLYYHNGCILLQGRLYQ